MLRLLKWLTPSRQSTYETKLRDELGLRKKLKARDWIAVQQHITARGNRPSKVYFRGVAIPDIKVKKEVARNLRKQVRSQASPIYCWPKLYYRVVKAESEANELNRELASAARRLDCDTTTES